MRKLIYILLIILLFASNVFSQVADGITYQAVATDDKGKEIAGITNDEEKAKLIAEKEEEYRKKFANPYEAAKYGYIDDVIEPRNTRFRIIRALHILATKKDSNPPKKHANIPL